MSKPLNTNLDAVWRAVTLRPSASVMELSKTCHLSTSTVNRCLHWLHDEGYVIIPKHKTWKAPARARKIIMPCIALGHGARIIKP